MLVSTEHLGHKPLDGERLGESKGLTELPNLTCPAPPEKTMHSPHPCPAEAPTWNHFPSPLVLTLSLVLCLLPPFQSHLS